MSSFIHWRWKNITVLLLTNHRLHCLQVLLFKVLPYCLKTASKHAPFAVQSEGLVTTTCLSPKEMGHPILRWGMQKGVVEPSGKAEGGNWDWALVWKRSI